jgi:transglutaminase-like putative cysteine protease
VRTKATRADQLSGLIISGLLLVAFAIALAGLYRVLQGVGWWWQAVAVVAITLGAAAAARSLARHPAWGSLAGAVVAFLTIVAMFVSDQALFWIIPTGDTIDALRKLEAAGLQSIAEQDVPAQPEQGVVFLVCVGAAAMAVLADLLAIGTRTPALSAIPIGILLLVPSFVRPAFSDAGIFVLVAVVFVGILLVRAQRMGWRGTAGLAGAAIVVALAAPVVLPPVIPGTGATSGSGLTTGLNPIVTLGDDLRRGEAEVALTYMSSTGSGQYLRLAVLDDFTGVSWRPTVSQAPPGNFLDAIPDPPGLTDAVPRTEVTTDVQVANVLSRWLPVPYSPKSVTGVEGTWGWEPDGLSIRSERSNARDQAYQVQSIQVQPTVEQLLAAGTAVQAGFDRYLQLPEDLPAIVGETAVQVVGGAATNFERAIALQSFFTGGDFTYSEDAPVDQGYDGSGASVLAAFLEVRSGYCVHFSSAMAAMARTLGIPARVAVGFTPGMLGAVEGTGAEQVQYTVTTHDLHAWPELYFQDIGWVRFEPTPGRGTTPSFAQAAVDDPETPDVDESVPTPAPTTTAAPPPTTQPELPPEETAVPEAGGASGGSGGNPWIGPIVGAGVLLLRTIRRARRLRAVDAGSAEAAWIEIRDTVTDLGWAVDPGLTPRRFAADLGELVDDEGRRLLDRLRGEVELELFAARPGAPSSDDVAEVLRAVRRAAGLGRSLMASFAPRTLLPATTPRSGADRVVNST